MAHLNLTTIAIDFCVAALYSLLYLSKKHVVSVWQGSIVGYLYRAFIKVNTCYIKTYSVVLVLFDCISAMNCLKLFNSVENDYLIKVK
jgi:hypothetical protein